MHLLSRVLISLLLAVPAAAQMLPNNCANPYWADSLRCKAFPGLPPQLNLTSAPSVAADIKPFTRVFLLADPNIRCLDGTRPVIYVDKAIGGDTNDWVFTMTGGESISPYDTNADGIPDDAQHVVDEYADPVARAAMGSATTPPMQTFAGIERASALLNPEFSNWNRVRVDKCSYDRYMGRAAWQAAGGFFTANNPAGAPVSFNLYSQGFGIMIEALEALAPGLTYTTWQYDPVSGAVVAVNETLPPLTNAGRVLFAGHSAGANGLYHNIDHLAAAMASVPGFSGDVRALFDANFLPAIENEPAFDSVNPFVADIYDHVTTGTTIGALNTFTYDGAAHYPASYQAEQFTIWNVSRDSSCMTAHAASGDDWRCYDRYHVLFNHIATPFMFREDFTDPNIEHLYGGIAHLLPWGDRDFYAHCPAGTECLPLIDPAEHRARLEEQVQALIDESLTGSELATNADPSLGAGTFPTFYAWMPDCSTHDGALSDSFYTTDLTYLGVTHSMREWLEAFWTAGRTNVREWRVDGWTDSLGNAMTTTRCP